MERNNIYHGNSLEMMKKLEDKSIDLVVTSPPYADLKNYHDFQGIHPDKYVEWFIPFCKEIDRVLKDTGSFILNINDKVVKKFRHPFVFELVVEIGKQTNLKLYERLFWNKLKSLPNRYRFGDRVEYLFWFAKTDNFTMNMDEMRTPYSEQSLKRFESDLIKRHARTEGGTTEKKSWAPNPKGALPTTLVNISSETKKVADDHVAVYPVELAKYFIKGASNEGDLVLDPFMGTGSTGVACKELKRDYIGFDIIEKYTIDAKKRIDES